MDDIITPAATALDSPGTPDERRQKMLTTLERLGDALLKQALRGEIAAAQLLLDVEKQRAALLGLLPTGAASGLRVAAGASAGKTEGDPTEVKVVVEYVQDWREARRQRGEG